MGDAWSQRQKKYLHRPARFCRVSDAGKMPAVQYIASPNTTAQYLLKL
jgi:hypothetical protein